MLHSSLHCHVKHWDTRYRGGFGFKHDKAVLLWRGDGGVILPCCGYVFLEAALLITTDGL